MAEERYGLETFLDNRDFDKGLSQYLKGINQFTNVTMKANTTFSVSAGRFRDTMSGRFVAGANAFASSGQKISQGLSATDAALAVTTAGASILATAVGNILADAFSALTDTVQQAVQSIVDFGTQSLAIAGRVDELNRSALLLGQRAGYAKTEVQGFLNDLANVGIRADVAATLIAQLSRAEFDLSRATELATVAQNSAVIAGIDSSDALEGLTNAAVTNQIRVARTAGVIVNFTQAQEAMAKELGTSTENLTEQQKVQANFNAILAEGAKLQGVYKAAMDSPTKALRSLGREVYNLQAQLGAPFLAAWASIVNVMRQFVQYLAEATREGGALYPVLVNLGALVSLIADGIQAGASRILEGLRAMDDAVVQSLSDTVMKALRFGVELVVAYVRGILAKSLDVWNTVIRIATGILDTWGETAVEAFSYGAQMVVELARGIIQAASTILVQAMNYIGSILSYWLSPGSPPRIAPELDQWGAAAMAEWLRGWTEADFDVLSSLESEIQSALGEKGLAGLIDELMTAVDAGEVTADIFQAITEASGEYGDELAILVQSEIAYAEALDQADRASARLEKSQSQVARLQAEYNDLLRSGADEATLKAKLDQINAAEREVQAAKEQGKAAAKNMDDLETQAALQKDLVKQLTKLMKLKEKQPTAGGGGGAGAGVGKAGGLPELPGLPVGEGFDFETSIAEAIEEAKQNLLDMFTGENSPFAPLVSAWETEIQPRLTELSTLLFGGINEVGEPVDGLVTKFQQFALDVSVAWQDVNTAIGNAQLFISQKIAEIQTAWGGFQEQFGAGATVVGGSVQGLVSGFLQFSQRVIAALQPIQQLAGSLVNVLGAAFQTVTTVLSSIFLPIWQAVMAFVRGTVMPLWRALAQLMSAIVGKATEILAGIWQNFLLPALVMVQQQLVGPLKSAFNIVAAFLRVTLNPILKKLGETILPKIKIAFDSIATAVNFVIKKIKDLADKIANIDIPDWLQPGSPPPLYYALMDIGKAMERMSDMSLPRFEAAFDADALRREMQGVYGEFGPGRVSVPAAAPRGQMIQGGNSYADQRQANFHIGNINTPMDQLTFETMADRWLQSKSSGRTF